MRSRRIPGRRAYEWGIATECVADAELEASTDRLVDELCGFPPLAQRTEKKLLNDIEDANFSLAIELEVWPMTGCAARTISARASRPFIRSADRNSPADDLHGA
jgi:enoyl-CoA hydratase/carnithine racemase